MLEHMETSSGHGKVGGGGKIRGPKMAMCHICGREFGQSSLPIHVPQCAQKWEEAEAQKPPRERRPLPQQPDIDDGATLEERNAAVKEAYESQAMAMCSGCGRRFKDECTLQKHQRSCHAARQGALPCIGSGGRTLPSEMQAAAEARQKEFEEIIASEGRGNRGRSPSKPKGPRMVMCHICGREFGQSSLPIHVPQCAQKWEEAEAQKPPRERKPLPQKPDIDDDATLDERNAAIKEAYESQAMAVCSGCGRRFKDESTLQKHERSCHSSARPGFSNGFGSSGRTLPPEMQAAAEAKQREFEEMLAKERGGGAATHSKPKGPRMVMCHICGREFGQSSLPIHIPQCAQKWVETEAQKPPSERKPLPQKPDIDDDATLEERNAAVREVFESQAMAACSGCGRRFKDEETLSKHQRSCRTSERPGGSTGFGSSGRTLPPEMLAAADAKQKEFEEMVAREGRGSRDRSGNTGHTRPKGPRMVMCHICGREFGQSSLPIHLPQCAQKWEETEAQKPPRERKPLPQKPDIDDDATLEERNAAVKEAYESQAMAMCSGCGRRFKDEGTLQKHQRSCHSSGQASNLVGSGGRTLPPEMQAAADAKQKEFEEMIAKQGGGCSRESKGGRAPSKPMGPRMVMCHICGREFGQASLPIHLPQCAQKWEEVESQKPPRERKPLPQRPDIDDDATLDERNAAIKEAYASQAMAVCSGCGRRFKDEGTLQKHQRSCHLSSSSGCGSSGRTLPPEMQVAAAAKQKELDDIVAKECKGGGVHSKHQGPKMVMCYICGREFGVSSLPIHQKQCSQKWEDVESKKPVGERRPLPQKPHVGDGATLEEQNVAVREAYETQAMSACPRCGRRFKDTETLQRHERGCSGNRAGASQSMGGAPVTEQVRGLCSGPGKVQALFKTWDVDGSGTISKAELSTVLVKLGCSEKEADVMFERADLDRDGTISFDEFIQWVFGAR